MAVVGLIHYAGAASTEIGGFGGLFICFFLWAVAISLFVPAALCPAHVLAAGSHGQPSDPAPALTWAAGCP